MSSKITGFKRPRKVIEDNHNHTKNYPPKRPKLTPAANNGSDTTPTTTTSLSPITPISPFGVPEPKHESHQSQLEDVEGRMRAVSRAIFLTLCAFVPLIGTGCQASEPVFAAIVRESVSKDSALHPFHKTLESQLTKKNAHFFTWGTIELRQLTPLSYHRFDFGFLGENDAKHAKMVLDQFVS